jgi:hypothetical protein
MNLVNPIIYIVCIETDKEFDYITAENFHYHITGCKYQKESSTWHMDSRFSSSDSGQQFGNFILSNMCCSQSNSPYLVKNNKIYLFFKSLPMNEVIDMMCSRAKKFNGSILTVVSISLTRYQTNEHLIYKVG